jgi:hypothetical protein
MEKLRAAMTAKRLDSEVEGTKRISMDAHEEHKIGNERSGVILTNEEWADFNRSMGEGDVKRVIQYLRVSTKRYKLFVKALHRGKSAVLEFLTTRFLYSVRPRPKPKPQPDMVSKLTTELGSLERYERSALARKRRAIRRFDALRDD